MMFQGHVVIQCPGCELWQIDYHHCLPYDWSTSGVWTGVWSVFSSVHLGPFHAELETILREHLLACSPLHSLLREKRVEWREMQ